MRTSTGRFNTACGALAHSIGTDNGSTAVGYDALCNANAGYPNTAVLAMTPDITSPAATDNIAIGYVRRCTGTSANPLTATSAGNIAIGDNALTSITGGATSNVAIGYNALTSSTVNSTAPNTAIGFEAMEYATTATNNTAIGNLAMQGASATPMTGAGYNVALGDSALNCDPGRREDNTPSATGHSIQAIQPTTTLLLARSAPRTISTVSDYTAVGYQALSLRYANAPGDRAWCLAGQYITTGTDNIAIGYEAMVGTSANPLTATSGGNIAIGD